MKPRIAREANERELEAVSVTGMDGAFMCCGVVEVLYPNHTGRLETRLAVQEEDQCRVLYVGLSEAGARELGVGLLAIVETWFPNHLLIEVPAGWEAIHCAAEGGITIVCDVESRRIENGTTHREIVLGFTVEGDNYPPLIKRLGALDAAALGAALIQLSSMRGRIQGVAPSPVAGASLN